MIINIDRTSGGVTPSSSPLTYEVSVADDFTISKTIEVIEGEKHKEINGVKLYKKPMTIEHTLSIKIGEEEVEEITDRPMFETSQKCNTINEPLFYAQDGTETTESTYELHIPYESTGNTLKIYDEEGNIVEELPTYYKQIGFEFIEVTESENVIVQDLQPIMLSIPTGIYFKDIFEDITILEETFEEVEFAKEATEWEEKEIPNMILVEEEIESINEEGLPIILKTGNYVEIQNGVKTIQVETAWVGYEPVMVPNIVSKFITLKDNLTEFTVEDILNAKYQSILDSSMKDYIIADMFLNEDDIDLTDTNHLANTGIAILQLLPYGQVKTKSITLETPSKSFSILEFEVAGVDVYLAGKKFVDGKLELTTPVNTCTIKFVNTTDKFVDIKSYAIAY